MLIEAKIEGGDLVLGWSDGRRETVSLVWLRDHCPCAACQHPETRQRLVDSFAIPAGLSAGKVEVIANSQELAVDWLPEGHASRFDAAWLAGVLVAARTPPHRVLWDRDQIDAETPKIAHDAMMSGDAGLREFLERIEVYGFCFVEGTPATPEATRAVAERVAYIRETIFGGYWDFTANLAHKDTAYTSLEIGPHTDGTYSFDAPGYQMFHCLAFDGVGGENVFVDAFRIADEMRRETPDLYRTLTEVEVTGQYLDHEKGIHLQATRPAFRLDAAGALVQVSFNNLDRAPMWLPGGKMADFYRAYGEFARRAGDRRFQYRRRLAPGSLVLFDNWRLLHARDAYSGYRRLAGAYLNKEDVESRLRVLRIKVGALKAAA